MYLTGSKQGFGFFFSTHHLARQADQWIFPALLTKWADSWDYKLNLQTCTRSNPLSLHVWLLVRPFVYFHTLCVRTAKALARLGRCEVSPEPSLFAYAISTIISWAGSNGIFLFSFLSPVFVERKKWNRISKHIIFPIFTEGIPFLIISFINSLQENKMSF